MGLFHYVKAILLDVDALSQTTLTVTSHGKLREPSLIATHIQRAFGAAARVNNYTLAINATSNITVTPFTGVSNWPPLKGNAANESLNQEFLLAPSVFNFFSPNFSPTGPLRTAKLSGPEFQILNESSALTNLNHSFRRANAAPLNYAFTNKFSLRFDPANPTVPLAASAPNYIHGQPARNQAFLDFDTELNFLPATGVPAVAQANALLAHLNTKLCYGMLSTAHRDIIRDNALLSTRAAYTRDNRVRDAIFLIISTPDYLVQK